MNHCQGDKKYILEKQIYLEKKEKTNLVKPIEKIKRHAIGWSKEKNHRSGFEATIQKVLNTK